MLTLALFALSLATAPQEPSVAAVKLPKHPVAALEAAIDLPTPGLRAAAATELAQREMPLKQWLAAAKALRLRTSGGERLDARTVRYKPRIDVMGGLRTAEILVRTPPKATTGPQPALFCWHAAGGDGASSMRMWTKLADRFGLLLVAPTETYELYRKQGWSYHPDGYIAMQAALRFVRRHYDVDEDRIIVAGLRGGGHMAWDVGLRFADQFAALLPANGSPRLGTPYRDSNMAFLESIAHVPVRSLHWGELEAAQIDNVKRAVDVLRGAGATDAHRVVYDSQDDALNPLALHWVGFFAARRTVPDRLVKYPDLAWSPHRLDFGRHHWVEVLKYDRKVRIPFPPTVKAARWRKLDAAGRLAYMDQYLRDSLPRIEVRAGKKPGEFDVEDRHIRSFRLLLTPELMGKQETVIVRWRGHTLEKPFEPSAEVFLRDFVERFDRTFLPIAEVRLP